MSAHVRVTARRITEDRSVGTPRSNRSWGPLKARDHCGVLFELDRVTASRGGKVVLAEVSCQIAEGATCVVGPSGAGKSSLLRLLNRLSRGRFDAYCPY